MPIDPAYLSFKPIEFPNPMSSIGALMQMRGTMAEVAVRQAQAQYYQEQARKEQAETEQKNRDLTDENTEKEFAADPETAKAFGRGDYSALNGKAQPGYISNRLKLTSEAHAKLATADETKLKNLNDRHAQIAQAITGLKSLGDDSVIAQEAPNVFARLQADGVIPTDTQMPPISGAKDLDRFAAQNAWLQGAIDKALAVKKAQQDLSTPYEHTITTEQGIMGFNPETKAYDIPAGQPIEKRTTAAPTITTDEGIMQWNPETKAYDIQAGKAPDKGDRNPTEASLAEVATDPSKTPEQRKAASDALKRLDQSKLASRPNINVNMTPAQAESTADMIGAGKIDPATTRAMLRRQPGLLAQVVAKYPDFDDAQIEKRYNVGKEFASSSNSKAGGQVIALNTLIHHADLYMQTAEALKNGTFKPGNAAYNAVASTFGSAPPTNADLVARFFAGETAKVATGGVPAEGEVNGILAKLGNNASPDGIAGAGKTLLQIAGGRMIPLMEKAKDAHLENVYPVIGPDASEILKRRGFNPATMKPAAGGAGMVRVISPEGVPGSSPADKLQEALKRGFKQP